MGTDRPTLILVSGAPATGKTTLALRIGRELNRPVLCKDAIKERLFDTLGARDRARSRELGAASFAVLYETTARLLDAGVEAVVEGNFQRGPSERELQALTEKARAVLVHCYTTPELVTRRCSQRFAEGGRHPGHHDEAAISEVLSSLRSGAYDPLDLPIPVLRVDTSAGYMPRFERIREFVQSGDLPG